MCFFNIFDVLISGTEKISWWPPVFEPDFYIFSHNDQLRKFKEISSTMKFKEIYCIISP